MSGIYNRDQIPADLMPFFVRAEIGLEPTLPEFIAALVETFDLCRQVLADDGTAWVNMGDSYAQTGGRGAQGSTSQRLGRSNVEAQMKGVSQRPPHGLKAKDLIGQPWRLAFALQDAGWYLRQDIIWHKPNPMPESVRDRCTKAHEYIFLLSKSERYYFDAEAIKERAAGALAGNTKPTKGARAYEQGAAAHRTAAGLHQWAERQRSKRDSFKRDDSKRAQAIPGQLVGTHRPDRAESEFDTETRNKRSVWTVATEPYGGAHFATFPTRLIAPCILAGAPAGGIVLDPFFGSGTTGQVAQALGRRFIGIELNPAYKALQDERYARPVPAVTGRSA